MLAVRLDAVEGAESLDFQVGVKDWGWLRLLGGSQIVLAVLLDSGESLDCW